MEWTDEGIVLGVKRHGESSVILELMTQLPIIQLADLDRVSINFLERVSEIIHQNDPGM